MTREQFLAEIDQLDKIISEARRRLEELKTDYITEHARFKEGEVVRFRLDGRDVKKVGIVKNIMLAEGGIVYILAPVQKDGSAHPWKKYWREECYVREVEK